MQLQLLDPQVQHLLALAYRNTEDAILQTIAATLNDRLADHGSAVAQRYRDAADEIHGRDGEIEIDEDAVVSPGDDPGAYVQAWVWVSNSAAGLCACGNPRPEGEEVCATCGGDDEDADEDDIEGDPFDND